MQRVGRASSDAATLARGLGWLGIGLGVLEVMAPRRVAREIGMRGRARLVAAYGLREIVNGAAILGAADPTPWVWARVGGDALDITTHAATFAGPRRHRANAGIALAAALGITALDVACALALSSGAKMAKASYNYGDRRGMPHSPEAMRGAARDAPVPKDMRIPEALRPYPA